MKSIHIIESIKILRSKQRIFFSLLVVSMILLSSQAFAQGVGIGATSFTPDASAILELQSTTKGFLLPRMTTGERNLIGSPLAGLTLYNSTTNSLDLYNGGWLSIAPLSSPTFTGTVTLPTPFTLGAISVTSTGTQLNYLNAATGTTGTTSTNLVFSTSPTLVTPTLGDATATTINKVTLTTPATGSTLTIADGKTMTASNTLTFTGTDGSSIAFGTGGTATFTSNNLSVFSATTSAQLAGVLSDETGTGLSVFATGPTFTGFSSTGAIVDINANSNFATNINTGTSTGAVSIGNTLSTGITQQVGTGNFSLDGTTGSTYSIGSSTTTGTISIGGSAQSGTITLGSSTAAQSVLIGNGVNSGAQIVSIANGNTAANTTVNILSGTGTAGAGTLNIGDNQRVTTIDIGNVTPVAARTTTIAGFTSAVVDQINIGTGAATVAGGKTINIGTTAPTGAGTNVINIGASSTTNGNGVRLGNRVIRNYPTAPSVGGTVTLTAAQVLDAGLYVINANSTITFPTAAALVAAMPSPQVGDVVTFGIAATGNFTPTIAVGAGGTIGSQATGASARVPRYCFIRITNVGAPAYTIY